MSLEKGRFKEIPKDAVILTKPQAITYQYKILNNWPHFSDVWGFKYSRYLLAMSTTFSSMYINNYFRTKFRLLNYGRLSSYLPICVVPAAMSVLVHTDFVTSELVVGGNDTCPVCLQTRAAALQTAVGFLIPFALAPTMGLSLVHRFHTIDMPYISKEPKKVFKIIGGHFARIKNASFGFFLGHALLASIVTLLESNSVHKVNMSLIESIEQVQSAKR
ncbi:unnamed protein product [Phyllotreta striolata]|uniref:Uncharacterized protein n=1 Tax=Phyllotreta striolata TaxID=444603 RepID=A0A9N9XMQ7_PHYSR|nr:unnamed protein product [Phyllotreta striolata]